MNWRQAREKARLEESGVEKVLESKGFWNVQKHWNVQQGAFVTYEGPHGQQVLYGYPDTLESQAHGIEAPLNDYERWERSGSPEPDLDEIANDLGLEIVDGEVQEREETVIPVREAVEEFVKGIKQPASVVPPPTEDREASPPEELVHPEEPVKGEEMTVKSTLERAYLERVPVVIEYEDLGGQVTTRTIRVLAPPTDYLLAYCYLRHDKRRFLTKMISFAVLNPTAKAPAAEAAHRLGYYKGEGKWIIPTTSQVQKGAYPYRESHSVEAKLESGNWQVA